MGWHNDPLWEIAVRTTPAAEEAVGAMLASILAANHAAYHDLRTGHTDLTVYLRQLPTPQVALRRQLRQELRRIDACGLDTRPSRVRIRRLWARDWVEAWKRHFPAFEVGQQLLVRPSWSRRRPRRRQRLILLDPGLSFGTGHHPTTRFCLNQLAACRNYGQAQSVLDIGTGSGLLALAAARLGFEPVLAFDSDPQSVRVARSNARRNRLLNRISIRQDDIRQLRKSGRTTYDVVCANLTADLLLAEHQRIARWVRPGGSLILAGILGHELREVRELYEACGFRTRRLDRQGEWTSIRLEQGPVKFEGMGKSKLEKESVRERTGKRQRFRRRVE